MTTNVAPLPVPPPSVDLAPSAPDTARRFGLPTASALVVGSVIGTGVFALPSALAGVRADLAGRLRARHDRLDRAGPHLQGAHRTDDIVRRAVRLRPGRLRRLRRFLNAWSYWITAWAGNAAIVVAWVGYVEVFWNTGHARRWSIVIALAGLWLPAAVNLAGLRSIAWFQILTTVIKFIPLLFIATVGLLFVKSANFGAFNASGGSSLSAISAAAAIALFSYLGIETASVAAGRVRDPERNVGRATVLGTLACAFVYILGTVAVFGTVAHARLVGSSAPFTDSANAIFGGVWAGKTVAVAAIVSGIGALVGWTLIVAEMPQAAARDNLFPEQFARESRAGVPAFGIIVSTALASVLTVVSYTSFDKVFTTIVLLSVLTSVIPYLFSAAAQLAWLATSRRTVDARHMVRDVVISGVALVFSFWTLAGSGYQAVYYGTFCVFLGVPVYVWMRRARKSTRSTGRRPHRRQR